MDHISDAVSAVGYLRYLLCDHVLDAEALVDSATPREASEKGPGETLTPVTQLLMRVRRRTKLRDSATQL